MEAYRNRLSAKTRFPAQTDGYAAVCRVRAVKDPLNNIIKGYAAKSK